MPNSEPVPHVALLALLLAPRWVQPEADQRTVRLLQELTWRELVLLVKSGYPKVNMQLSSTGMDHALRSIRDQLEREDRLDYFIEHGATTALLRRLFRLPVAAIKARRAQLLGPHKQRRPRLPRPAERDAVHRVWWEIRAERRKQPPTVEDYVRLHRAFPRYTFASLEATINEFDD